MISNTGCMGALYEMFNVSIRFEKGNETTILEMEYVIGVALICPIITQILPEQFEFYFQLYEAYR